MDLFSGTSGVEAIDAVAVLGIDACKGGWVGIRLEVDAAPQAWCAATVEALVKQAGPLSIVAIDIPIGLPGAGGRAADVLARKAVGPRASSVFSTPAHAALGAGTHAEASALSREITGLGISQQAYALGPKILEVDSWLGRTDVRVVEVHPEVSFAVLAGAVLREPKSSWAGFELRRRLLSEAGLILDGDLGLGGCRGRAGRRSRRRGCGVVSASR